MSKDDLHVGPHGEQGQSEQAPSSVVAPLDEDAASIPAGKADQEQQDSSHLLRNLPGQTKKLLGMVKWGLVFEFLIVLAAFLGLYMQHRATQESLRLAREASENTRRSVEATEDAVGLSKDSLNLARQSFLWSIGDANRTAGFNRDSLEETRESNALTARGVEVSEATAKAAQEAVRITERARLDATETTLARFEEGKMIVLKTVLTNRGQITATLESQRLRGWVIPVGERAPILEAGESTWASAQVPPGLNRTLFTTFNFVPTAELVMERMKGKVKLVFVGEIVYRDDLGGPYSLPRCLESWNVDDVAESDFKVCSSETEEDVRYLMLQAEARERQQ